MNMIKTVNLDEILPNPDNPRQLNETKFKLLVKSIKEFPEMMKLREIIVDENMMILGGNMRYMAMKKLGIKECVIKIAKGLTEEQKKEFIIKDNVSYGEWDFDALANNFETEKLIEWGLSEKERKGYFEIQNDTGEEISIIPYPITLIVNKNDYDKWQELKNKYKIKDDNKLFFKLMEQIKNIC